MDAISVASADEALALVDQHEPTAFRLHANRSRLDADEGMPDDALTIVLDRVLVDVPLPDRWAHWHQTIDRIVLGLDDMKAVAISEIALTSERLTWLVVRSPDLTWLSLHACGVDDEGARTIGSYLFELDVLRLASNVIGDRGVQALGESSALIELDVRNNRIGDEGAQAIAARMPRLSSLDLIGNAIGEPGAQALAGGGLEGIQRFSISGNSLGEGLALRIAERWPELISLDLAASSIGNPLREHDARAIAERLGGLTHLGLRAHRIGDAGVSAIASQLTNLLHLDLGGNSLSPVGAGAIAAQLTGLGELSLGGNRIGDEGAAALAEGLPSLTSLDLARSHTTSVGVRAIAEHLTGLRHLDVSDDAVDDEAAEAIAACLSGLTELHLTGSSVGDLGARAIAERSTKLTTLDLVDTRVTDAGVRAVAEGLAGLDRLRVGGEQVTDVGVEVICDRLTPLSHLSLWNSSAADAGLAAVAHRLPNLTVLDIENNRASDDTAHLIAHGLPNLETLILAGNRVGELGLRTLLDRPGENRPSRMRVLDLVGNPGVDELGVAEVTQSLDAQAIKAAYRRWRDAREDEKVAFGEAKLIVLGEEAVGKTSLVRALVDGARSDPDEQKTQGVNHQIWVTPWAPVADEPTQLNIWDFGGQEIMHQTHRYFLSERCILVVVLDRRKQDDTSVESWLRTARHRAPRSPVVVVVNKCDDGTHNLDVDFERLRHEHPEVVGVFRVSCSPDPAVMTLDESLAPLRECLRQLLTEDERLESVRTRVPKAWVRVRDEVRARAADAQVLSATEFVNLCRDGADTAERVTDEAEQRALLRMLHQMGVVVAHGLTPETTSLAGLTLLDPNWFTSAVYALLDYGTAEFDRRTLGERLRRDPDRAPLYPDDRLDYIVDLLQQKQFALAFRLPGDADPPRYLLPEALSPTAPPTVAGWDPDSLRFRYRYRKLARGVIPQFQVFAHPHAPAGGDRWRTGCMLVVDGCPVLIDGDLADNRVEIHVAGPRRRRRDALAVVRSLFAIVHERVPEVEAEAWVPLPDKPSVDVRFEHLCVLEGEEGSSHEFRPDGGDRRYSVEELLDGVRSERAPAPELVPQGRVWQTSNFAILGQAPVSAPFLPEPPQPDRAGRGANLGQIWAIAGGPIGVASVGLYVLGEHDGWQPELLLGGLAVGAAVGGVIGLVLGLARRG